MQKSDFVLLDALSDEVKTGVDVFRPGVVFRIFCQSLSAFIVHVEGDGRVWSEMEFSQDVTNP